MNQLLWVGNEQKLAPGELSKDRKRGCPSITRGCHYPQLVLQDAFIRSLWDSSAGKVGTLEKWPNYCPWAAGWAEGPPECLLDSQLEDLLSGVCAVGKELADQAAASGKEESWGDVHFL